MKVKKTILFLVLLCAFAVGAFALPACGNNLPDNSAGVSITLIVLDTGSAKLYQRELSTKKSSLYEAFNEFGGLQVQTTSSLAGAWVNSAAVVGGDGFTVTAKIQESFSLGTFIAVYHDIDKAELKDLSPYAVNLTYSGKEYFYSGVGVSLLPLYDGATYILALASY